MGEHVRVKMASSPSVPRLACSRSSKMAEKTPEQWIAKLKSALKDPKLLVLLMLFLQNSVSTLVRRYVLGIAKVEVSYAEALLVAEMIKGAVAVYYSQSEVHEASGKTGVDYIFWLIKPANSWQMLALAALYGVMNVLNFVAARRLSSSTFTVLVQLKILATAVCSVTMLGRSYSSTRWRAVMLLVLSSILVASRSSLGTTCALCEDTAQYTLGVVAVLCEVAGSGFASVYFERVVKATDSGLSIWARNVQLAFYSCFFFVGMRCYELAIGGSAVGHGWSLMVLFLSFLGALGGILIALTIKYADALAKTMAITGSIGVLALIDYTVLSVPLSNCNVLGVGCTMIGVLNYALDTTEATPPPKPTTTTDDGMEKQPLVALESVCSETDAEGESQ